MNNLFFLLLISPFLLTFCSDSDNNPIEKAMDTEIELIEQTHIKAVINELNKWQDSESEEGLNLALKYIRHQDSLVRKAASLIIEKNDPEKWITALQNAKSFKEEITLLAVLIKVDKEKKYEQTVSNRLQTFDLRHLKEKDKLAIISLYKQSLEGQIKPSTNFLETAKAKLMSSYPSDNEQVNKDVSKLLEKLDNQLSNQK